MLPLLKSQIFCFWSKFVLLTQLSRQQIQFSKLWLCHFFYLYGKIYSHKKLRKSTEWILRKMHYRQTYRKTHGQTNRNDFIGPPLQRWRFDQAFLKWFLFLSVTWKEFSIIWSSVGVNLKPQPIKSNSEQYQLLFNYVYNKSQGYNFFSK